MDGPGPQQSYLPAWGSSGASPADGWFGSATSSATPAAAWGEPSGGADAPPPAPSSAAVVVVGGGIAALLLAALAWLYVESSRALESAASAKDVKDAAHAARSLAARLRQGARRMRSVNRDIRAQGQHVANVSDVGHSAALSLAGSALRPPCRRKPRRAPPGPP